MTYLWHAKTWLTFLVIRIVIRTLKKVTVNGFRHWAKVEVTSISDLTQTVILVNVPVYFPIHFYTTLLVWAMNPSNIKYWRKCNCFGQLLGITFNNQCYEYMRIDMIVKQDNFFSIHITMLRTIWTQKRQN